MKRKLVLENGKVFSGVGFGSDETVVAEIIFNTAMVGYHEILSNPVYADKIVCMSYPLIGNYGLANEDYDNRNVFIKGFVVREYNDIPSNFRSTMTLNEALEESNVCGISELDTRELVRILRDKGSMKACICDESLSDEEALKLIASYNESTELTKKVSTKKVWHARTTNPTNTVVVIDLGVRKEFAYSLNEFGCNVVVLPYNSSLETVLKHNPTGVIISDGPANPKDNTEVVELVKSLVGKLPILGIGTGALEVALAYEGETSKLLKGYYGCNYPVRNIETGKIQIVSLNTSYKMNIDNTKLEVSNVGVIDNEVFRVVDKENKVTGSLYLDENLLNEFVKSLGGANNAKKNRS